jgi:hypothetical protein
MGFVPSASCRNALELYRAKNQSVGLLVVDRSAIITFFNIPANFIACLAVSVMTAAADVDGLEICDVT